MTTSQRTPQLLKTSSGLPELDSCVQCGLCLPVCPTYAIDRRETENPRGRISALRAVEEEHAPLTPPLASGLDHCLVCRACESACPAGISMETLITRHRSKSAHRTNSLASRLERFFLEECISQPRRVQLMSHLLSVTSPILRRIPGLEIPSKHRIRQRPLPKRMLPSTRERGRVTVMRGCIADHWFREETRAAGALLALAGFHVEFRSAGCCGALHRHAGLEHSAAELARNRARDLLKGSASPSEPPDHIVIESAGCAASLLHPIVEDPALQEVAARVTDTASLLTRCEMPEPTRPFADPIAFFPPCHQQHGTEAHQRATVSSTRELLERVAPGALVTLPGEQYCCGAAGTYMLRERTKSQAIGKLALERWEQVGRPHIATGNPGCLLRWESLIQGSGARALHPVVIAAHGWGLTHDR